MNLEFDRGIEADKIYPLKYDYGARLVISSY